jgi:hypothetical protein
VEIVNAKLAPHGMKLSLSSPDFFGSTEAPDGFGVACQLNSTDPMAYDGRQYLVATEECLYVGGSHAWSDGVRFSLCEPQVRAIADTIADSARSLLER